MDASTVPSSAATRFRFGRNWARYVDKHFSAERLDQAQRHLLRFLRLPDLEGRLFLDIGCGSGIHSLAAWQAGARRVISFDIDTEAVETTARLHQWAGQPDNWDIRQGSILDADFMAGLGRADIVYSWGVLHHTGAMWDAVAAAARALAHDGVLLITLYCKEAYYDPPAEYWLDLKQRYNRASRLRQRWMEWQYAWRHTIRPALRDGTNPFQLILGQKGRGMSYWTDVRDWLGGWPMEFAGVQETRRFCTDQLGLELLHFRAIVGNAEYLFRRQGVRNYWDTARAQLEIVPLAGPFDHVAGHCWQTRLPAVMAPSANAPGFPDRSRLMLYEDGVPLGFAHALHAQVEQLGLGRFSHWGPDLLFATSDNTDPNQNGRHYSVCLDGL